MNTTFEITDANLRLQSAALLQQAKLQEFNSALLVAKTKRELDVYIAEAEEAFTLWLEAIRDHHWFNMKLLAEGSVPGPMA